MDGTPIAGFAGGTLAYSVVRQSATPLPVVSATATDANATISITQASAVPGTATIAVTAQDGTTTRTYTVNFSLAAGGTYTIVASEDSYVVSTSPTANYNSTDNVYLQTARDTKETWLKFDLSGISGYVTAATLNVTGQSLAGTVQMYAYSTTDDSWSESGITWANKPTSARTLQSPTTILTTGMANKCFDLLNLVKGTTDGKITIVLVCNIASGAQIYSKDASSGKPYLQITAN